MKLVQKKQKTPLNPVAFFISDLHLQQKLIYTTQAFYSFLMNQAVHAQYLYLLGDIFEYWAGDDDIATPYNYNIINALRDLSEKHVQVFWLSGNRDFLVGKNFAVAANVVLLTEPHVIKIANLSIALVHGDAQCTDDHVYMAFRGMVRKSEWKKKFLDMPLPYRKKIIQELRKKSCVFDITTEKRNIDVNSNAIRNLYNTTGATVLIHGHTHKPALHITTENNQTRLRYVLPNWEYDNCSFIQGGWIGITDNGAIYSYNEYNAKLIKTLGYL